MKRLQQMVAYEDNLRSQRCSGQWPGEHVPPFTDGSPSDNLCCLQLDCRHTCISHSQTLKYSAFPLLGAKWAFYVLTKAESSLKGAVSASSAATAVQTLSMRTSGY